MKISGISRGSSSESASAKVYFTFGTSGSSGYAGVDGFDQFGAELVSQHCLDLAVHLVGNRLVVRRPLHHVLPQDRDAHPWSGFGPLASAPSFTAKLAYGCVGMSAFGRRGERIARVVVAGRRVLDRIEHLRGVGKRARVDAGAVDEPLVPDAAAVRQDALRRQQQS